MGDETQGLTELQSQFETLNKLPWHYKNLEKYEDLILKAVNFIEDNPGTEAALKARLVVINSYEKTADYRKKAYHEKKYINALAKFYDVNRALDEVRRIAINTIISLCP